MKWEWKGICREDVKKTGAEHVARQGIETDVQRIDTVSEQWKYAQIDYIGKI
jgi:hypothetical protein